MNVLLVNPYITSDERYSEQRRYPMDPLGLLYLASYANREIKKDNLDINIKILDAELEGSEKPIKTERGFRSGLSDSEMKNELLNYRPDIVGITSNYATAIMDVIEISKLVKKIFPRCIVILGGAHATTAYEELIKEKYIDIIVRREGEVTFFELLKAIYNKKSIGKILGVVFKREGKIRINSDRPLIENLDYIPLPDRSLIPYKKYLKNETYFTTMNFPVATVFSSRGCPYNCIFCSTCKVWGNKWRPRSPENMIKEVESLIKNYGVKEISFMDDQFMGSKERIKEFCRMIIKKNIKLTFIVPPGISPSLVDDEVIDLMLKAGFYRICFSIDVGTEAAKKFVRKPVQLEKMREVVRKANSKGLWTYAFFVTGYPYEKEKDIYETIKYAYSLKVDFLRFYIAQPYKGAELYNVYTKLGMIKEGEFESKYHDMSDSIVGTKYISPEKLRELRFQAEDKYIFTYASRFLNPIYFFREFFPKISSYKKFKYFLRLLFSYRETKSWMKK